MILYKYVTADRIDVLEGGQIRFTQPDSFNDPFETLPHVDAYVERSQISEFVGGLLKEINIDQEYERILQEIIKEYNISDEDAVKIRQYSKREVVSMAETFASPIMERLIGLDFPNAKETVQQSIHEKFSTKDGAAYLFSFPPEIVKEIVLGCRISDTNRKKIKALVEEEKKYRHVRLYQTVVDSKEFKLNINPI